MKENALMVGDSFLKLAAKQAKVPEVIKLFEQLSARDDERQKMNSQFSAGLVERLRAAGKARSVSESEKRFIESFKKDVGEFQKESQKYFAKMDDSTLLSVAWSSEAEGLRYDERVLTSYSGQDRFEAEHLISFRKETIRLIEDFIENSPFHGQVKRFPTRS